MEQAVGVRAMPRELGLKEVDQHSGDANSSQAGKAAQHTIDQTPIPTIDRQLPVNQQLSQISQHIAQCQRCGLCRQRHHTVPGQVAGYQLHGESITNLTEQSTSNIAVCFIGSAPQ